MALIKKLHQLRQELLATNEKLIKSMLLRKEQVHAIQEIKVSGGKNIFCPEREFELFTALKTQLCDLSLRELLSLSLIIEEDACSFSNTKNIYPAWSEGEHLQIAPTKLFEQINPIMLKVIKPMLFKELKLKAHFDFIYKF